MPWTRPLCALRCFVRLGASIHLIPVALTLTIPIAIPAARRPAIPGRLRLGQQLVLRHRIMGKDFALEHPHLDAAGTVGGLRRALAEIDIGTQCVQWHAPFAIPLHARDLGAAEPAPAVDAYALRAKSHGRLHRALHRAAERHAALQLLSDAFGN